MWLTTASPDNNRWLKELRREWEEWNYVEPPLDDDDIRRAKRVLNSLYGKRAFPVLYESPTLRLDIKEDPDWWRGGICRADDPENIARIINEVNKAKKEKETAMNKTMKDYVGCKVLDVKFVPPHTTIFWDDGTVTRVKCADEPYDSEKGFAMAVMKKLFGDNYYKDMKSCIMRNGEFFCYADTDSVRAEKAANEIKKLKEENEQLKKELEYVSGVKSDLVTERNRLKKENDNLKRSNELMSENIRSLTKDLNNIRYSDKLKDERIERVLTANRELAAELHRVRRENKDLEKANKHLIDENDELRRERYCTHDVDICKDMTIATLKKENEDLKKAKENMAKKLAEAKELKKDLDDQMLKNGELHKEIQELRVDIHIKSGTVDRQHEVIRNLRKWFEREAEKVKNLQKRIHVVEAANEQYKDIVNMQKEYDELKEQYELLDKLHKGQMETISKQRDEIARLEGKINTKNLYNTALATHANRLSDKLDKIKEILK